MREREGRRAGAVQQRRAEDRRLRARAVTGKPAGAPKGERRAPRCNGAGGGGGSSSCSSSPVVSLTCRTCCICSIDASDGCSAADARFWIVYRGRFRREHDPHSCGQQLQRSLATRGITADRRARCAARRPAWTGPRASPRILIASRALCCRRCEADSSAQIHRRRCCPLAHDAPHCSASAVDPRKPRH